MTTGPNSLRESLRSPARLVLRNAFTLMLAQVIGIPLSMLLNAMMGRYFGPDDLGYLYLAATYCNFGFLFVEWGQNGTLPAAVATDRSRAGELLGTGVAWRLMASGVVYALLAFGSFLLDYGPVFQVTLALSAFGLIISGVSNACQDTVRGFERMDVAAYGQVGQQFLSAAFVAVALFLGGRLHAVLLAQCASMGFVLLGVWRMLRPVGVGRLSFSRATLKYLLREGYGFLFLRLTIALQPSIDAAMLSKFAPAHVVGWHAAALKLISVLVFPASALIGALYPTLARLSSEDPEMFRRTASNALRTTTLLVIPLALGCLFYPDLGTSIYGRGKFGAAESNLRILSVFVFLVYFSMTLGTALAAAGRQRGWAIVQSVCLVISIVADPILIPYFERRYGNGGLGVCVSTVCSEILMVCAGIWLTPRGVFDRKLVRSVLLVALAGAAMAVAARGLAMVHVSPFIAAPIALAAYFGCLYFSGGLRDGQLNVLLDVIRKKGRKQTTHS